MSELIAKAKAAAWFLYDFLVPRFITEEVALRYVGDPITTTWSEWGDYEIECSLSDVEPGESFDGIATVDSFVFLWFGITYRVGNFRAWPEGDVVNRAWREAVRGGEHG